MHGLTHTARQQLCSMHRGTLVNSLYNTIPQHQTARRHGIPLHVLRKHARCAQGAPCMSIRQCLHKAWVASGTSCCSSGV